MKADGLFWGILLAFVLVVVIILLAAPRDPTVLRMDELLANPELWVGSTVRVIGGRIELEPRLRSGKLIGGHLEVDVVWPGKGRSFTR